jgi:hypothetical protein
MTRGSPLYSKSMVRTYGIPQMGRYSCKCGKWIMLPPTYTKENPLICEGITIEAKCGIKHYWENQKIEKEEPETTDE